MRLLGVDYGGGMLKVVSIESARSKPQLVMLADVSPYVPTALQPTSDGAAAAWGWGALQSPHPHGLGLASRFRDRLKSPDSSLQLGSRRFGAVELQAAYFTQVGGYLRLKVPDSGGAAFSVPSNWSPGVWSLPPALAAANLRPSLYVHEWCAALAYIGQSPAQHRIIVTAGVGGAQVVACQLIDATWRCCGCFSSNEISGGLLRERLVDRLANEVIGRCRRDPREDTVTHVLLQQSVEELLLALCHQASAVVRLNHSGIEFQRVVTRDELATLCTSFQRSLLQVVQKAYAVLPGAELCGMLVWGELQYLLPLQSWLAQSRPGRSDIQALPLDAVASGTAKIAAYVAERGRLDRCGVVNESSGEYWETIPLGGAGLTPMCNCLPEELAPPERVDRPWLIFFNEGGEIERRELMSYSFRLGRDVRSDWAFRAEEFPGVSHAHAVIVRDGAHYEVRDLESANGTYVNAAQVPRCVLNDQDVIRLGNNGPQIRFEYPAAPQTARERDASHAHPR